MRVTEKDKLPYPSHCENVMDFIRTSKWNFSLRLRAFEFKNGELAPQILFVR